MMLIAPLGLPHWRAPSWRRAHVPPQGRHPTAGVRPARAHTRHPGRLGPAATTAYRPSTTVTNEVAIKPGVALQVDRTS